MMGTVLCFPSPATSECGPTRANQADTMEEMTMEVSWRDSLTPSWMSSFPRNMGWPPNAATALSVLTRVRVLRLLNVMAMVFPVRDPRRDLGIEPDLKDCLWEWAFRTRVVSSVLVRSAMLRRCLGAKGEVEAEEAEL